MKKILVIALMFSCWVSSSFTASRRGLLYSPTVFADDLDLAPEQENYRTEKRTRASRGRAVRTPAAYPAYNREYYLDNPYNTQ